MCKETDEKDAATSRDAEMSDWPLFKSVVPEILCAQKSLLKLLKNAPIGAHYVQDRAQESAFAQALQGLLMISCRSHLGKCGYLWL